MPFILPKRKQHKCYLPTARNYGEGSLYQCATCHRIYKLISHDKTPSFDNWVEITREAADKLIAEFEETGKIRAD